MKRAHDEFLLVFKTDPRTAISMESSRRALSIGMPVDGPIRKTSENTTWARFTFTSKWVHVFPQQELTLSVYVCKETVKTIPLLYLYILYLYTITILNLWKCIPTLNCLPVYPPENFVFKVEK